MKSRAIIFYFTLLFCLSSIQFFGADLNSASLPFYIYDSVLLISVLILMINYRRSFYTSFSLPILLLLLAELIAALNATCSWDQNIIDSFKAVLPYMAYLLFFLLTTLKFTDKEIQKIIVLLGGAYIIVYLVSFSIYPVILFKHTSEFGYDTRGFQRIIINGIGFLCLFSFYSLGEYINRRKFGWLIMYLFSMACIIMTLTRTLILFSILFSLIFILKKSNNLTFFISLILTAFSFYIIIQMNFYKLIEAETVSQTAFIKEDIKVQSADYYLNHFSPNLFSKVFGNGQPYNNTGYARFVTYLEDGLGFYTTDIGYIGLYVKFGILALLSYLIFIYKTFKTLTDNKNSYCKYFLLFIFFISFIIDAPFNTSFIPSIVLAVYILSIDRGNKKSSKSGAIKIQLP